MNADKRSRIAFNLLVNCSYLRRNLRISFTLFCPSLSSVHSLRHPSHPQDPFRSSYCREQVWFAIVENTGATKRPRYLQVCRIREGKGATRGSRGLSGISMRCVHRDVLTVAEQRANGSKMYDIVYSRLGTAIFQLVAS